MHPVRFAKKKPVVRWHHGVEDGRIGPAGVRVLESVLQGGEPGIAGMGALHGLLELHLVTEEDKVLRAPRHGDGVGQRHLAGFINEKEIEGAFPFGPGKEPGRSTYGATRVSGYTRRRCL